MLTYSLQEKTYFFITNNLIIYFIYCHAIHIFFKYYYSATTLLPTRTHNYILLNSFDANNLNIDFM